MIRLATATDFIQLPTDETAVRIHTLYRAYGSEYSFLRFYSDGVGGLLSVMDGVGIFSPSMTDSPMNEWGMFIRMDSTICQVHCPAFAVDAIADEGGWHCEFGSVLRYDGADYTAPDNVCVTPSLPVVYSLLETNFPGISPFDAWYPDVSHRVRHGCCHVACVIDEGMVVSSAMTVALTNSAAVIGQVATVKSHRRRGLAGKCVKQLISMCEGKTLYILPLHESAERLYTSLGFAPCGSWAELNRIREVSFK